MSIFASALFTDESQVREIRLALETLLRQGFAEDAAERLEEAVGALAMLDHPIVPLCEAVKPETIEIIGWDRIAERITRLYRADQPITALGIDLSTHGDDTPDDQGFVEPFLETSFYNDTAYPFSRATRADLLAGYRFSSSEWQGNFEDIDGTISVRGLGELNAAVIAIHDACCRGVAEPDDHDAYFIASALIAVRLHQAVREAVMTRGLPCAMAVLVGSNESYPFFDAPVVAIDEYRMVAPAHSSVHSPAPASTAGTSGDEANTGPVATATADPADMIGEGESEAEGEVSTGTSLRQLLAERAANEPADPSAHVSERPSGLLGRLFRRA